jgi:hypothetical protein
MKPRLLSTYECPCILILLASGAVAALNARNAWLLLWVSV